VAPNQLALMHQSRMSVSQSRRTFCQRCAQPGAPREGLAQQRAVFRIAARSGEPLLSTQWFAKAEQLRPLREASNGERPASCRSVWLEGPTADLAH